MEDLFRSLPNLLRTYGDAHELRQAVVFAAWRRAAGSGLADQAVPFRVRDKTLIIAVKDAGWKRHLESLAGQMIFKLNSVLQSAVITFIEFRVDEARVLSAVGSLRKRESRDAEFDKLAAQEVNPALELSAESIRDEQLRGKFLSAAGSCLARKKRRNR